MSEVKTKAIAAVLVAVLVIGALTVMVTLPAQSARAATHPFRSLRIGVGGAGLQITTLNPMGITLVDEYIVTYNVYSTLLTYDKSFHLVGDLAYKWSLGADGKTWTFNLVHGAYFTNPANPSDRSHPVTAADVNFTFDFLKANVGNTFDSYVANVTTVRIIDDYTVQIVLNEPLATMESTAINVPILPKYIWSTVPQPLNYKNSPPIGSGVYYYDATNTTSTTLVLRRNPNYYGETYYCQVARPDEVRFIGYPSSGSMVSDFISHTNNLDIITSIDSNSFLNSLASTPDKWAVNYGFVGEFSINAMTDAERQELVSEGLTKLKSGSDNQILATNLTVRQAIAMSMDKPTLVKDALLGLGEPADTLIPSSNRWHYTVPSNLQYKFDPAAARQLLNAQGWKYDSTGKLNPAATPLYQVDSTGKPINGLIFRLFSLNTDIQWQIALDDIVGWLGQAGIVTTGATGKPPYDLFSINQLSGYWASGDYDMWLWDWVFAPYSDPSLDVLNVETTQAILPGISDNYYSNATYDAMYNESLKPLNPAARQQIVNNMSLMIYRYASYILPYYRYDLYAATTQTYGRGYAWTNFGNWTQTPGLVPDESPPHSAWYDMAPTDNLPPTITGTATVYGAAGASTLVSVSAADPEGDPMTFTWDFGDGSSTQTTSTSQVSHTYAQAGNYTINVRVSDGEWPVCGSETATVFTPGSVNLPPNVGTIQTVLSHNTYEEPNKTIPFNITVQDSDNDPLNVTWTFGDQSAAVKTTVANTKNGVVTTASHSYSSVGNYTVSVVATDGKTGVGNHTQWRNLSVEIRLPPPTGPGTGPGTQGNPWVDIGVPVAIVAAIAVVAAAVFLRRRRAQKEEEKREEAEETQPPPPSSPP